MGRVLLVEDDHLLRYVTAEALREDALEVVEARSGDEALNLLHAEPIDLVFSDIDMPGTIDGLVLAQTIKAVFPEIRIILTSGKSRSRDDIAGLPFVQKPYRIDDVLETIQSAL